MLIHPVWLAHAHTMRLTFQWAAQEASGAISAASETTPDAFLMAVTKDGRYMNWHQHFDDLSVQVHEMLQECGVRSLESRPHAAPVRRIVNPQESMLTKNKCLVV